MRKLVISAALVALVACGGGGGEGGGGALSPLTLTIDDPALDLAWRTDGQTAGDMYRNVNVTIAEPLTEVVYVGVEEDDPVLDPADPLDIGPVRDSSFMMTLAYNHDLAPGTYRGKIRLLLCGDERCSRRHPLTGNEISYVVTVAPGIVVTALINGVPATVRPVDMTPGAMVVSSTAGDRVRLVFSEDVDITPGAMRASASSVVKDATSWEGTVACQPDLPIFPTGTLMFDVTSRTGPQASIDVRVGVKP